MALSEIEEARISKQLSAYCEARVPLHVRNKVRMSFRISGHDVILFEERPAFQPPHDWHELPVAKFTYVRTRRLWRLYCLHRDLKWHEYRRLPAAGEFDILLREVDEDPTHIFWG